MSETYKTTIFNTIQGHKALLEAWSWVKQMSAAGHRLNVVIKPEKRSTLQNKMMWALLTDVSNQVNWYGEKLSPEDWKIVLSASLRKQRAVPGIDGGFVVLGLSTSKMTKAELSDMITLIEAFGAEKGVKFTAENKFEEMMES